ncbi:hypothetical protein Dred_2642 [Desulforamulus reducens MI-1]|uniref:VCBS repeat-containing protein n=1 Tax=Desulforamulus reducens (strain ATCC BAA-1160 / DSM 100696 / MI-1) TaxID=349161 RepID=A4J7U6_DESRM|nr:VCBS repeat-containing protein [Desulforamulus reducens]ABO51149.1 hypothetical protein Dred_2642 [Desulforamulus reducens MI-1]
MIRKIKSGITALLISSLLTGCNFMQSPMELLKQPSMDVSQAEMKRAAEQFLPTGSQFTIPLKPSGTGSFRQADLDGDGSKELLAFYKNLQAGYEMGALILKKEDGKWQLQDHIKGLGQSIDYGDLQDVTGDKKPELLVGWSGADGYEKELEIYSFQDKKAKRIGQYTYNSFSTGDLDEDGKAELAVLFRNNKEIPSAELHLYQAVSGELKQTAKLEYEGGYPAGVVIGQASKDRKGIFVDIGEGAHSAVTQLVFLENNTLRNVFSQSRTFKPYSLPSEDVDKDGVMEIGIMYEPPGTEQMAMAEIPWVNRWYKWDGKDGLLPVLEEYSNYIFGYRFIIPQNWIGKFTVKEIEDNPEKGVEFDYIGKGKMPLAKLLTLHIVPQNKWQEQEKEFKKSQAPYIVLGEKGQMVFVGVFPEKENKLSGKPLQEYQELLLKQEQVKEQFEFISSPY